MTETGNPFFFLEQRESHLIMHLRGEWVIEQVAGIEDALARVNGAPDGTAAVSVQCGGLHSLDLSGAWLLHRQCRQWRDQGLQVDLGALRTQHLAFIDQVMADTAASTLPRRHARYRGIAALLVSLGRALGNGLASLRDGLGFLGRVCWVLAGCVRHPSRLRLAPIVRHIEETGFRAIPIVCLLAFLISIVLAYQGTTQLSRFGAEIFTIDLVAISVLREMGVLLTAIMVAGRSGSAFAAEIGVMKLNQEVAAMQTLGIDPMHALMVPRLVALMITLPMLTLFADIVGFVGGAVVSVVSLGIPFELFMDRLQSTVTMTHFLVGMSKAPVFAFVIALIGIRQGFLVEHSAEDVGRNTTRAVVQSIFAVIALDALYSVVTTELGY